jgi:hypothetical protein
MLVKKLNYLFGDQASVGGNRVISSFFEFSIFFVQEEDSFSYQVKREKRLSSVEIEMIIFCQLW